MIKLIVTDIDGTLVNSKKELPKRTFSLINKLYENNIRFCAASGRQYYNLLELFEPVKDKMSFVADNGSIVFDNNVNIIADELDESEIINLYNHLMTIENIDFVFCGLNSGYIRSKTADKFKRIASKYYGKLLVVDELLSIIKKDKICKIAVYDYKYAETNSYTKIKPFFKNHQVTLASHEWVDIMNLHTNKGNGVRNIQKIYNVTKEETMVFGDYLNDYEMMFEGKYSYAMANAHPKLKEVASSIAPSNDEEGVITIIENYLKDIKV